ncbi:hypothetical protein Bca4012_012391 [Brassica carinata]|uniref:RING-type E3 ubiquitin transferase n=1 Tax=Brassica carinata TaxID=52824 RepID=A0A8X7SAT9_BRACI|nr:hypothetical protein Bca52824_037111 [Brassica carinata]
MASNNRKMLYPNQPGQSYTFTFYIPWSQIYPPPPPPPPPPPQRDLSVLVSTSICIIGSFLLFLFLTVFLYLYITKSRRSSPSAAVAPVLSANRREDDEDEDLSRYHHHVWRVATLGLHRSAIDSITVVGFKKGEGVIDGTDCSVCLSEFEEDEMLRLLPKCSHAFHVNCIDAWLLSHKNCPLCRAPVFTSEVRNKKTETSHHQISESGTSNGGEEESSGSRNVNVLPRSQSDLASHCGGSGGRLETVRRSFSIGGSSLVKAEDRSRRLFNSSFSANFFSSSRRTTNQDMVLPS